MREAKKSGCVDEPEGCAEPILDLKASSKKAAEGGRLLMIALGLSLETPRALQERHDQQRSRVGEHGLPNGEIETAL